MCFDAQLVQKSWTVSTMPPPFIRGPAMHFKMSNVALILAQCTVQ